LIRPPEHYLKRRGRSGTQHRRTGTAFEPTTDVQCSAGGSASAHAYPGATHKQGDFAAHGGNSRRRPMLMFPARRTQWWSLAAMAMAATALAVILIESPVRSAPVIPGATVALASDGKAA